MKFPIIDLRMPTLHELAYMSIACALFSLCASCADTKYSHPDLIEEQSEGGLVRYYIPGHHPEDIWPNSNSTTFFLKENLKVTILSRNNRVTTSELTEYDRKLIQKYGAKNASSDQH